MNWFDTPRTVGGLRLNGGFLMESGPFGHSGAAIAACMDAGFSAVSTETITLSDGTSPWWNLFRQGESLYNCSKWSDIPLERWLYQEIPLAKARGAVVIATVGHTAEEVEQIVPALVRCGVDAIKVCTYHAHEIVAMTRIARRLTGLPVWAKISANWPNFLELAQGCQQAGADALVAIDTLGPVCIPEAGGSVGWMSGVGVHGRALYVIDQISRQVRIPVVGVGGILDADGVRRARAAGAELVGLCSAVLLHGLGRLEEIQVELRQQPQGEPGRAGGRIGPAHIAVNRALCNGCGRCVDICGYLALRLDRGVVSGTDEHCRRCGLCQQACSAIRIEEVSRHYAAEPLTYPHILPMPHKY